MSINGICIFIDSSAKCTDFISTDDLMRIVMVALLFVIYILTVATLEYRIRARNLQRKGRRRHSSRIHEL
jgi:hypothetical protein